MGCRMGCVILVLGEMDVARVNLYRSDHGTSSALGLIRTPSDVGTLFKGGGQGHRHDFFYWDWSPKTTNPEIQVPPRTFGTLF